MANTSPVLSNTASPTLGSVLEGATNPSGVAIASMVVDGSITDADGTVEAIAVTGLDTRLGTWQYSLNGGTSWLTIDAAQINGETNELALLLGPTAQIRLLPYGDLNGTLSDAITFRAWDMTNGTQGSYTVITSPGTGAFSAESDAASLTVTAVNDAPTFAPPDGAGTLTTAFGSGFEFGYSATVLPDGKILVAGVSSNGSNQDFALVRFNGYGTLDASFSGDGKLTTDFGLGSDFSQSVTVQADGKILVAGYAWDGGGDAFALARYNNDGTPDTGFSGDGTVTTAIGWRDFGQSVTVQPDGRILVAGYSYNGTNYDFALVRYNSDGTPDTSFAGIGRLTTAIGSGDDRAYSVTVAPDGGILVAGQTWNGNDWDFTLVRYHSDGTLDTSFSGDGIVTTDFGSSAEVASSVTVQADGKILVSGISTNGSDNDFALARYNNDGTLDTSFSGDGMLTTDFGSGDDVVHTVTVQPDGKILVAGYSWNGSDWEFAVARYNSDGTLDTSFNGTGFQVADFGSGNDYGLNVTVQPDGKILIVGESSNGSGLDFAAVRYNSDGSLDTAFGGSAVNTLDGAPVYIENAAPVALDTSVAVYDVELADLNGGFGDYAGASLTLTRHGGANSDDQFDFDTSGTLFTVSGNELQSGGLTFATFTSSGGTLIISFTDSETIAATALVNDVASHIFYANGSDAPPSSVQVDWTFSDGNSGAQGSNGPLIATGNTLVSITAVNDAPENTVPGAQSVDEDTDLVVSGVSVDDVDGNTVKVTLSADAGILTLSSTTGLTFTTGDGTADASMIFSGTQANVNAALDGLVYRADLDYNGNDTITLTTSDLGGSGTGGELTATDTIDGTVGAVNDAPTGVPGIQIGATAAGVELTATPGTLADADGLGTITHTWESYNGSSWDFLATGTTYAVQPGDIGKDIHVVASYIDDDGTDETVSSALYVALNPVTGNGEDPIVGSDMRDLVFGGSGSDEMYGGGGDDTLDGGVGDDRMIGGTGNDTYVVNQRGDRVIESRGEGTDTVLSSVSHALPANAENLILTGGADIDGKGTRGNNALTGNVGDNRLFGGDGNDVLDGGNGNDTLNGAKGHDSLTGGNGSDIFVFSVKSNSDNADTITDFTSGVDTLELDHRVFGALGHAGALSVDAYYVGPAVHDTSDRIVYDDTTGNLYYDKDGTGNADAVLIVTLVGHPTLTASDILIA